ncbi:MAG: class I SAM-dependent methyltransferase [Phycisphaerae bacterium]|nr:class I SAM-dependent methyltransferase [Phycisphaerae bacterium]
MNRQIEDRLAYLEAAVEHLYYEKIRLSSLVRYLLGPEVESVLAARCATKESFDWQWDELPQGKHLLSDPAFCEQGIQLVLDYTQRPREWFEGKSVADVGCGNGRFSWVLGKLGANVLSLDQSEHALESTRNHCADMKGHRVLRADLLQDLPTEETFDLVWCYGVLHHTGDTYRAFCHTQKLVKSGGWLFLMLYGEPAWGEITQFQELALYDRLRLRSQNLSFREKIDFLRQAMHSGDVPLRGEEYIHGYFDAISPPINDLYTRQEVEAWLSNHDFEAITKTAENRNLHILARKK